MSGASGDGSTSVCARPEYAPIAYHWYAADSSQDFQTSPGRTLAQALIHLLDAAGILGRDQDQVIGEVAARMQHLQRGRLRPISHVKGPMGSVTGVEVFEVRTRVELGDDVDDVLVRIYHVEPGALARRGGSTVIGLHLHLKDVSDPLEIRDLQNVELQHTRSRYFQGKETNWQA